VDTANNPPKHRRNASTSTDISSITSDSAGTNQGFALFYPFSMFSAVNWKKILSVALASSIFHDKIFHVTQTFCVDCSCLTFTFPVTS